MKSVFLCIQPEQLERVYDKKTVCRIIDLTEHLGSITSETQFGTTAGLEAEVAFSTWGMPVLSEAELAQFFPKLKAVFYAASSVQAFARPLLARNIRLLSAWKANAVPVAEYTVAQIIL